jgi:hypothetical protein
MIVALAISLFIIRPAHLDLPSPFPLPPSPLSPLPLPVSEPQPKLSFSLLDGTFDEHERFLYLLVHALVICYSLAGFVLPYSFSCSASSFADALNAWRGVEAGDEAEHNHHQQQQQLHAVVPIICHEGAAPSAILSVVCYNCCKKLMGEAALSCVQVCSKNFCSNSCSDAHWSKNKIRCRAPACPRRFFLLKDGIIRGNAAFCSGTCADIIDE